MNFTDIVFWIKVIMGVWFTFAFLYWIFGVPIEDKKEQWKDKKKKIDDFWKEHRDKK